MKTRSAWRVMISKIVGHVEQHRQFELVAEAIGDLLGARRPIRLAHGDLRGMHDGTAQVAPAQVTPSRSQKAKRKRDLDE